MLAVIKLVAVTKIVLLPILMFVCCLLHVQLKCKLVAFKRKCKLGWEDLIVCYLNIEFFDCHQAGGRNEAKRPPCMTAYMTMKRKT